MGDFLTVLLFDYKIEKRAAATTIFVCVSNYFFYLFEYFFGKENDVCM